jgi:hypothetical protein
MFLSWWRRLARWSSLPPSAKAPRGVGKRPHVFLGVEALEGRWVPATVTTLSDGVPGSLRDAIAATPAGGTVDFQPGLSGALSLTGGTLVIDHNLTIAGPSAAVIVVSGEHTVGVLSIAAGVTAAIDGLTIANGPALDGGGIVNNGALTITNSTVVGNGGASNNNGGGIYNQGTLAVANTTIAGNSAHRGGGIYNVGTLVIANSTVANNLTSSNSGDDAGGGIENVGTAVVTTSTVVGNSAHRGGGISSQGALTITTSTVKNNTAPVRVFPRLISIPNLPFDPFDLNHPSDANPFHTMIVYDFVGGDGGGIDNAGGTLTVTNSTVAGNSASQGGGISNNGTLTITNSTIASNTGGGINTSLALDPMHPVNLTNTLVATNSGQPDVNGAISAASNNLIGYDSYNTNLTNGANGNLVGTSSQPLDPRLGALQDNGGPTFTMALLSHSPAIDAGTNAVTGPPLNLTADQRGQPRQFGAAVDIGAFERQDPLSSYVAQLYHNTLDRQPNAGEVQQWVGALQSGAVTPFQAASLFLASAELVGLEVDHTYLAFLHRAAAPQERALWLGALLAGTLTEHDLVLQFLTSPEYTAAHPGNGDYVQGLYNDVLQRQGTADEVAQVQELLDSGALSRAQVADAFLVTPEALDLAVNGLFTTFLHRPGSAAELQLWSGALAGGQVGGDTAVAQFLSCPEYTGF